MLLGIVSEKKISSQSNKEIENFILANLRIITWETVFQKALRTFPPVTGQSTVMYIFLREKVIRQSDMLRVHKVQICTYKAKSQSL